MWRWCLNNKQAALQLRVEGLRSGKRLLTPDSHVDGGNGAKTVVYNTKKDSKNGGRRKKYKKEKERKRWKEYNSKKEEFFIIDHTDRACPRMIFVCMHVWLFPFNTYIYQYLYPRFRLAFSPTLYKFIVRAFWAWVHSCSGFKSKLVLTESYLNRLSTTNYFPKWSN